MFGTDNDRQKRGDEKSKEKSFYSVPQQRWKGNDLFENNWFTLNENLLISKTAPRLRGLKFEATSIVDHTLGCRSALGRCAFQMGKGLQPPVVLAKTILKPMAFKVNSGKLESI